MMPRTSKRTTVDMTTIDVTAIAITGIFLSFSDAENNKMLDGI